MYKIVITGPESSGKTSLAEQLARRLEAPCPPEFARSYLEWLGRPYLRSDLKAIARGQSLWENWYAGSAGDYLVCDTDWTVLQVWELYRFGGTGTWQQGYLPVAPADLYFLCAPDFPWVHDALREHPEERDVLYGLYEKLLSEKNLPFVVLDGDPEKRLEKAIFHLKNPR